MTRTDIDMQAVQAQAKQVIDNFFAALKDIPDQINIDIQRNQTTRTPQPQCNPNFKNKILSNAPQHDGDYIVAEKKSW